MYEQQINDYFNQRDGEFIELLTRLVKVNSIKEPALPGYPFGKKTAEALAVALDIAKEMGFTTHNVENYVGVVDMNDRETMLGILCHMDIVDAGTGWPQDPFQVVVKDGTAYGRGTADNKGPAIATMLSMRAIKDLGLPLKYNCRLILGTDEESGSEDVEYYFAHNPTPPNTFSPDGSFAVTNTEKGNLQPFFSGSWKESAALPRVRSLKGGMRINIIPGEAEALVEGLSVEQITPAVQKVEATTGVKFSLTAEANGVHIHAAGTGGHCASPSHGNNALTALTALVADMPLADSDSTRAIRALHQMFPHGDFFGEAIGIAQEEPVTGKLTLVFSILDLNLTGFNARFDSRTPLCATRENSHDVVKARFNKAGFSMECKIIPPHHTPADSPFVKTLLTVYEQYTGKEGTCEATGGGTYVHHIDGGVCYGAMMPGYAPLMHGANEHIDIQDMLTAAKIFTQVIIRMCM
jgi:succinyl-diaminopimelate desuccinylase